MLIYDPDLGKNEVNKNIIVISSRAGWRFSRKSNNIDNYEENINIDISTKANYTYKYKKYDSSSCLFDSDSDKSMGENNYKLISKEIDVKGIWLSTISNEEKERFYPNLYSKEIKIVCKEINILEYEYKYGEKHPPILILRCECDDHYLNEEIFLPCIAEPIIIKKLANSNEQYLIPFDDSNSTIFARDIYFKIQRTLAILSPEDNLIFKKFINIFKYIKNGDIVSVVNEYKNIENELPEYSYWKSWWIYHEYYTAKVIDFMIINDSYETETISVTTRGNDITVDYDLYDISNNIDNKTYENMIKDFIHIISLRYFNGSQWRQLNFSEKSKKDQLQVSKIYLKDCLNANLPEEFLGKIRLSLYTGPLRHKINWDKIKIDKDYKNRFYDILNDFRNIICKIIKDWKLFPVLEINRIGNSWKIEICNKYLKYEEEEIKLSSLIIKEKNIIG
ncbi:hypothetical protein HDV06_001699 [Boothiomyces sp. JEL0866]|nr:hypothetical protein HDV06_001699 [Boothiomyces sp. JEL0866]